mgnify:CR=1 FL=1
MNTETLLIELGTEGTLILGYLSSCVREQISGGKVTVGENESQISDGQVQRDQSQCDGGRLSLAANEAVQSGAMAMRDIDPDAGSSLTVHDTSPLLLLPKAGRVVIKRIDQPGERYKIKVETAEVGRTQLDLAQYEISLTPGAEYMLSSGGRAMIFQVADDASHDDSAILGRLIPL